MSQHTDRVVTFRHRDLEAKVAIRMSGNAFSAQRHFRAVVNALKFQISRIRRRVKLLPILLVMPFEKAGIGTAGAFRRPGF